MVKRDRFPEGYTSELIVPTLDRPCVPSNEFEGSGSSGQIDTEIIEDSHVPVTDGIWLLNADGKECLGVPTQVFHVSKFSSSERRDLVERLRQELYQVQVLQKRLELSRTNVITFSSSSNIHGCTNLKNPPAVKNSKKTSMFSSGHVENSNSLHDKTCGLMSKVKQHSQQASAPSTANAMIMNQCDTLLRRLLSQPYAPAFSTPVDVVKLNIPDYLSIIKHPMDLGSIKKKLASGSYLSPQGFLDDVRLTFSNAMKYNPPKHEVHIMATALSQFFEMRWKTIEKRISAINNKILPPKTCAPMETKIANSMPVSKKRKTSSMHDEVKHNVQRIMTNQEKCKLRSELEGLTGELPGHIIDFLKAHSSRVKKTAEDEIEIDIDDFSDESLFSLRKLLEDNLKVKHKSSTKLQPCGIELLNESGPSISPMQLCKENHAEVDAEGDICISSCATVGIKNYTNHRRINYISPGVPGVVSDLNPSSSESGLDAVKISPHANAKLATGPVINKGKSFDMLLSGSGSVSLNQPELKSQQKPVFPDLLCQKDGEKKSESERKLSPTKHYRAALLKNRFADTILKAREKTLKQGQNEDPERLRREREELERQKKKEKARLKAEAEAAQKAAEEGRRRAEEEAVREAKRMRDLQREAAREALQKMERTVEINESCGFLEDLESLRIPTDNLLSSVGETSPEEHSQDALGSFNFLGSNPLEQLGLYIKMDDEEEDGELPILCPRRANDDDMEEGEID